MKGKYKMPNRGKSDTDSGAKGSCHGKTGGLSKKSDMRSDVTKKPDTKNMYPNGLA